MRTVDVWCRGKGPACRPSATSRIAIPSESVPVEWLHRRHGTDRDLVRRPRSEQRVRREQSVNRRVPGSLSGEVPRYRLIHPLDVQAPRPLREWASRGVSGFRFHPVFFEDASWLDATSSDRIWDAAEESDSILQFHMRPSHADRLASIGARHPNVRVIVDHLGKPDLSTAGSELPILALADRPNTWIKIGDYQIASEMDYPWPDLKPLVRQLCDRFGTERMILGNGVRGASSTGALGTGHRPRQEPPRPVANRHRGHLLADAARPVRVRTRQRRRTSRP